jgi:hypothetical protein
MLIPTTVSGYASLAVPDPSYWCSTAAHYYINPPGTSADEACVWGSTANPWGNWSPYVAGANSDASGETFIKLGWNPIYLEQATPFRNTVPSWGVKIDCPNGGCNGLPCAIDPSQNGVNQMTGGSSQGAGGGAFCVVTVAKGSTANFVVFNAGGDQSDNGGSSSGHPGSSTSNGGQGPGGGQFFGQTSSWPSTTSTSTQATSTSTTWEDDSWSSSATSSSETATSTWSETTSTHHNYLPTHSPYYSLFNHTTYVAPTGGVTGTAEATAVPTGPSSTAIQSLSPGTGAASSAQVPFASIVAALIMLAVARL